MSTHQIKAELLTFGERRTLKTMIRAKVGRLTVREARELMSPNGSRMWIQAIFGATLFAGLGMIFLAPLVLLGVPCKIFLDRGRWWHTDHA